MRTCRYLAAHLHNILYIHRKGFINPYVFVRCSNAVVVSYLITTHRFVIVVTYIVGIVTGPKDTALNGQQFFFCYF